ncbi:MAG: carboxy-S-adenosyl-L-methionine synthase CmoA [Gammaproteobacteria bacterium]|nr:MAG: carboxy-S-adenosyl-L-methionine synthase CmoA [Gammaproteobacteria bacterium]
MADFVFDEQVASVFQDMIQRSVPGYKTIISAIGLLTERFAQPNSHCYDLGCSLGAATLSMRHNIRQANCKIIAIDNSPAMIERCQSNIEQDSASAPIELICGDIREVSIGRATVVVLNFTLQFIPPKDRKDFLTRIYEGMLPGGILILSEKLFFDDPRQQALHTEMHHAFKRVQGYSDLEISQKRSALERVMKPETLETHKQRLTSIGFSSSEVWFQQFNFASLIALK